ncbi:hypothetical protein CTAYLR_009888 [Chrysophaeum taylorii]|uniref:cGMP-dependent protein kinase n=1 Tax=Chrysophaeum taylorii TaxID=2483200 RepID=A0AAD7XKW3_9STRA|nr:hypothetical protein CTAYLR_009888 [Chrysophaeum taylorii]
MFALLCGCCSREAASSGSTEMVSNPVRNSDDTRDFYDPVEGWLHRVTDEDKVKVWACLRERHLYYYDARAKTSARPVGYVDLRGCRLKTAREWQATSSPEKKKTTKSLFFAGSAKKKKKKKTDKTFSLREGSSLLSATFECGEGYEAWIEAIEAAIAGRVHRAPAHRGATVEAKATRVAPLELPTLSGPLRKQAIGKFMMSKKSAKKWQLRHFKLEGGVLRYYSENNALKGEVSLAGCSAQRSDLEICVVLPEGKYLNLRAVTAADAERWAGGFHDTIALLAADPGRARRIGNAKDTELGVEPTERRRLIFGRRFVADDDPDFFSRDERQQLQERDVFIDEAARATVTRAMVATRAAADFVFEAGFDWNDDDDDVKKNKEGDDDVDESDELLAALSSQFREEVFEAGDAVVWQGEEGDKYYAIETGCVELLRDGVKFGKSLASGQGFGELALAHGTPRAATARCVAKTRAWSLRRGAYRAVAGRVVAAEFGGRVGFLRQVSLLHSFADMTIQKLAASLVEKTYLPNTTIIREGERGDAFFVVKRGVVAISTRKHGVVSRCGPGDAFGERALLHNEPRAATARVEDREPARCYVLERRAFLELLGPAAEVVEREERKKILRSVKLLAPLEDPQLEALAGAMTQVAAKAGDTIVKRGDAGDAFYVVRSGAVDVVDRRGSVVATLRAGHFFGESAILKNKPRDADVRAADEDAVLLRLRRQDFVDLLGPVEAVLRKESDRRAAELANGLKFGARLLVHGIHASKPKKKNEAVEPSDILPGWRSSSSVPRFESLRELKWSAIPEVGALGRIALVKDKSTGECFTLRSVRKRRIAALDYEVGLRREKDILVGLSSPRVASLVATASDRDRVYLLSEALPGGDLWAQIHENSTTSEKARRFYCASAVAAVEHLHARGVAHRSIAPEAFWIAADGRLKFFELSCARRLAPGDRANTLCGAPDYIAPEVILAMSHDAAVDLWALGVLIFEVMHRRSLFARKDGSHADLFSRIVHPEATLQRVWSATSYAAKLVCALLRRRETERLGRRRAGFADIWNHRFFSGITPALVAANASPPWLPPSTTDGVLTRRAPRRASLISGAELDQQALALDRKKFNAERRATLAKTALSRSTSSISEAPPRTALDSAQVIAQENNRNAPSCALEAVVAFGPLGAKISEAVRRRRRACRWAGAETVWSPGVLSPAGVVKFLEEPEVATLVEADDLAGTRSAELAMAMELVEDRHVEQASVVLALAPDAWISDREDDATLLACLSTLVWPSRCATVVLLETARAATVAAESALAADASCAAACAASARCVSADKNNLDAIRAAALEVSSHKLDAEKSARGAHDVAHGGWLSEALVDNLADLLERRDFEDSLIAAEGLPKDEKTLASFRAAVQRARSRVASRAANARARVAFATRAADVAAAADAEARDYLHRATGDASNSSLSDHLDQQERAAAWRHELRALARANNDAFSDLTKAPADRRAFEATKSSKRVALTLAAAIRTRNQKPAVPDGTLRRSKRSLAIGTPRRHD